MAAINIGDTVYLKTDKEQQPRICTAYCVRATGVTYNLACGVADTWHYECEVSKERDIVLATTG